MKSKNKRELSKKNYLVNEVKTDAPMSKNSFVSTIQSPALNESGIEAKKKGF